MSLRRHLHERSRRTDPIAGLVALAVTAVCVYWAFTQPQPFRDTFEVKAMLTNVNGVKPKFTPVRIAGVDVGEVSAVKSFRGTKTALVTMQLERSALPLHTDARVKMRPKLFLEGNSFIELEPGTPGAPVAREGMTIPLERTAVYVTLPHVLRALGSDTRANLQDLLDEYGQALNSRADSPVTGGEALNRALHEAARAMPTTAQLSDATTGRERGDLKRAIDGFGRTAEALNDSGELGPLLSSIRRSSSAFASESANVTATLRELPGALDSSERALRELRGALPPARALASATLGSLPELPAALDSGVPWLHEVGALLGPRELGGDVDALVPATRELAPALSPTADLLGELDLLSRCSSKVLIPTANAHIDDGQRGSGTSVWAEFLSATVGAGGSAQNFDGNGYLLRGQPGGSNAHVATDKTRWMGEPAYGNALAKPEGTRPAKPAALPPHAPDAACFRNAAPDLNGPAAAPGPADGSAR